MDTISNKKRLSNKRKGWLLFESWADFGLARKTAPLKAGTGVTRILNAKLHGDIYRWLKIARQGGVR